MESFFLVEIVGDFFFYSFYIIIVFVIDSLFYDFFQFFIFIFLYCIYVFCIVVNICLVLNFLFIRVRMFYDRNFGICLNLFFYFNCGGLQVKYFWLFFDLGVGGDNLVEKGFYL